MAVASEVASVVEADLTEKPDDVDAVKQCFSFRAVEFRRWVLRLSNTDLLKLSDIIASYKTVPKELANHASSLLPQSVALEVGNVINDLQFYWKKRTQLIELSGTQLIELSVGAYSTY